MKDESELEAIYDKGYQAGFAKGEEFRESIAHALLLYLPAIFGNSYEKDNNGQLILYTGYRYHPHYKDTAENKCSLFKRIDHD